MKLKYRDILATISVVWIISSPIFASPQRMGGAKVFIELANCREITDAQRRLACYDIATAALIVAEKKRDIVVVDRAQITQTHRSLFGFSLPHIGLFGGDALIDDNKTVDLKQIAAMIKSARQGSDGNWAIVLDDDALWVQIDNSLVVNEPKNGSKVTITRGALGAYWMKIDGQPAIKVRRAG